MSDKLKDFLTNLATDSDLVESFKQDKEGTMTSYGVDQDHIDLVVNKDYDEIQKMLGADYSISTNNIITAYKK